MEVLHPLDGPGCDALAANTKVELRIRCIFLSVSGVGCAPERAQEPKVPHRDALPDLVRLDRQHECMLVAPRGRDCAKRHIMLIGPPPQASAVVPRPESLRFALTVGLRFESTREDAMRARRVSVQCRVGPVASKALVLFSTNRRRVRLTL
jgi:hypothetical protein